jgi:hypothetical protein
VTVDPALPPPAPGEDVDDAAVRYAAIIRRAVKAGIRRLNRLAAEHGAGTVALANTGARGVRIVFVAADGTFGDVMVPSVTAAREVCERGGWEITGWDQSTAARIRPTRQDRIRMVGTGR